MMKKKNIQEELKSFSWKDLNQLIKKGAFKATKNPISRDTYVFIAKDENYETVVQLAFNKLQDTDPEHANLEEAIKVARALQDFAKELVKQEEPTKVN